MVYVIYDIKTGCQVDMNVIRMRMLQSLTTCRKYVRSQSQEMSQTWDGLR